MTIPDSVTSVDGNPFIACPLAVMDMSSGNAMYELIDGVLYDRQEKMLVSYSVARKTRMQYLKTCVKSRTLLTPLFFDRQDAAERGGGDAQPLRDGDIVLNRLRYPVPTHDQHMGAAQEVAGHIDGVFVFLRDFVV